MQAALTSPRKLFLLSRLFRALRSGATDALDGDAAGLVHAHWWVPSGIAAPQGVPMVLTCHGTDVRMLSRFKLATRIARPVFSRAKVVTTVSRALATIIAERTGIRVPDDAIVPMPVATLPRPATTGGGGILVIGRLSAQKRVRLAIEAFAEMRKQGYQGEMTIIGDGIRGALLERTARAAGVELLVHFVGGLPPARIPEYLAKADLFMMPAKDEGLGLAAVEALMQGVPVVACTDGGGLLDVVPPHGAGRIVPPTSRDIARAAFELVASPEAHQAALEVGKGWQTQMAPEAVATKCLEWYRRALA